MRRYLLAAVAAAAMATPALARDGSPYVGIEGGILIAEDLDMDVASSFGTTTTRYDDAFTIDFKRGLDLGAIAGYDFGLFRLEGELAYKRLRISDVSVTSAFANGLGIDDGEYDVSSRGKVLSLMANAMLDFGDENDWSGYIGAGAGRARVKLAGDRDSAFAYQGIAGIRKAVSPNVDVGLKYRYFRTSKLNFSDSFSDGVNTFGIDASGKLRTHSLLATLTYNFYTPAPAPVVVEPVAPPPPPPATQTCYDGSVILATDVCPQPPVETPPPPPVAAPERG